jgi:hypothetical protein
MALNLADRVAVRRVISERCAAVVANYALYILGNAGATVNQKAWAKEAVRIAPTIGDQVSWFVLNQPDYIADGSGISDASLTGIIEAAINNHFIGTT